MNRMTMPNPCKVVAKTLKLEPGTNVREKAPSVQEYNRLIVVCYQEGAPQLFIDLISAVWESGLRIREVLKWKVEDICLSLVKDGEGNIIELPYLTTEITKQRRKTRIQIPLSHELWCVLKKVIGDRENGYVWPWRNPPYHIFEKYQIREKAGLTEYRPFHDYRKSWKTEKKKSGLTKEYTKYLQGHATDSMDEYYTSFKRLDMQDAYIDRYLCDQSVTKK